MERKPDLPKEIEKLGIKHKDSSDLMQNPVDDDDENPKPGRRPTSGKRRIGFRIE
jgi:hypothetical protein